jgi:transposase-like protein
LERHQAAIIEIPQQYDRARSSRHKSQDRTHARFQEIRRAKITIAGIELLHRIRKNQFDLGKLSNHTNSATEMWEAVLAA